MISPSLCFIGRFHFEPPLRVQVQPSTLSYLGIAHRSSRRIASHAIDAIGSSLNQAVVSYVLLFLHLSGRLAKFATHGYELVLKSKFTVVCRDRSAFRPRSLGVSCDQAQVWDCSVMSSFGATFTFGRHSCGHASTLAQVLVSTFVFLFPFLLVRPIRSSCGAQFVL